MQRNETVDKDQKQQNLSNTTGRLFSAPLNWNEKHFFVDQPDKGYCCLCKHFQVKVDWMQSDPRSKEASAKTFLEAAAF